MSIESPDYSSELRRALAAAQVRRTPAALAHARKFASIAFQFGDEGQAAMAAKALEELRAYGAAGVDRALARVRGEQPPPPPRRHEQPPREPVEDIEESEELEAEPDPDDEPVPPQRERETNMQYAYRLAELAVSSPFTDDEDRKAAKRLLRLRDAEAGLTRETRYARRGSGCTLELPIRMTHAEARSRLRELLGQPEPSQRVRRLMRLGALAGAD